MSKVPRKTFSRDFNKNFLKVNLLLWKKAVLRTTTLTHCKATQVLRNPFNNNQTFERVQKLWKEVKDDTTKFDKTITELKRKGQIRKGKQISCSWNLVLV